MSWVSKEGEPVFNSTRSWLSHGKESFYRGRVWLDSSGVEWSFLFEQPVSVHAHGVSTLRLCSMLTWLHCIVLTHCLHARSCQSVPEVTPLCRNYIWRLRTPLHHDGFHNHAHETSLMAKKYHYCPKCGTNNRSCCMADWLDNGMQHAPWCGAKMQITGERCTHAHTLWCTHISTVTTFPHFLLFYHYITSIQWMKCKSSSFTHIISCYCEWHPHMCNPIIMLAWIISVI